MAADYEVTSIMQILGPGPGDHSADYVLATFALTNGKGQGQVQVPLTGDWSAKLTAAIEKQVAGMQAVIGG